MYSLNQMEDWRRKTRLKLYWPVRVQHMARVAELRTLVCSLTLFCVLCHVYCANGKWTLTAYGISSPHSPLECNYEVFRMAKMFRMAQKCHLWLRPPTPTPLIFEVAICVTKWLLGKPVITVTIIPLDIQCRSYVMIVI